MIASKITASPVDRLAMDSSCGNPITPARMPTTTNTKSTTRKGVSGCEMRQIRLTLAAHDVSRHMVESVSWLKPNARATKISSAAAIITASDAGSARLSTLVKNDPFTRALLGSKPSTKPGAPMQKKLMSVIWIGSKGYGGNAIHSAAKPIENSVLVRNSAAERCRLLMERRPSATTAGIEAKSLSTSTISATLRAASEPAAMATEQSASLSASTSLTPSPVMATVWSRRLSACTSSRFCCGVTRPKT